MPSPLDGRAVFLSGGTGSFGRAFAHHALATDCRRLVIYSRDELKQAEMATEFGDARMRYYIGDVRDEARTLMAMRGCDTVIHAAALKRIETCEAHPSEAVATNVGGTRSVFEACLRLGVQRSVLLSTDKAAAPNTLYGATKLAAERLWCGANVYAGARNVRFAATRYGNVLGSRGSVVDLFRAQAATGTLTLTDPAMTRFWMRLESAVHLVVLALATMRGGEVYVPKIGAATVRTLATAVAPDVPHLVCGRRPSEKQHETLITEDEARTCYDLGSHYVIEPEVRSWAALPPLNPTWRVRDGFALRSDTADRIDLTTLRAMIS